MLLAYTPGSAARRSAGQPPTSTLYQGIEWTNLCCSRETVSSKLEHELEELRTVRRSEVAERIKYAKDFGDISENAEYDEAKNEQGMLEGRILVIENMLRNAVIIEEGSESGIISVGTTVDVKDDFGKQTLTIVGPAEVDVAEGRISMESPVGKALLGHSVGETVDVVSPGGSRQIKIVKIN